MQKLKSIFYKAHPIHLSKKVVFLIVLINAALSYYLWTSEFRSFDHHNLIYLKHSFRHNPWFPESAGKIIALTSLSWLLSLLLFVKEVKIKSLLKCYFSLFGLTLVFFYFNRIFLYKFFLNTWFKLPVIYFIFAFVFLIPFYSYLVKLIIDDNLLDTGKNYLRWIGTAIVLTIPLSLLCLFVFNYSELTNNWYILTSIQKGYVVFWANLTIALLTWMYFKKAS